MSFDRDQSGRIGYFSVSSFSITLLMYLGINIPNATPSIMAKRQKMNKANIQCIVADKIIAKSRINPMADSVSIFTLSFFGNI
ncbi:MAG: hypothetical protein WC520_02725 [Candidatus Paceibacterota bacterium]